MTNDGSYLRLYVDGIETGTPNAVAGNPNTDSTDVYIGIAYTIGAINSARDWDGFIDIPEIRNRALSASEIALLSREPFCDLGPRRLIYAPAAGTLPVYMHHYRQAS